MPGEDKTEKASSHKRMEQRRKGNVFQSKDLISGAMILLSFLGLKLLSGYMLGRFYSVLTDFISLGSIVKDFSVVVAARMFYEIIVNLLLLALPILGIAMLLGVLMSAAQTRLIFSTEALMPKFSRLNPIEGIKKMFNLKALVELIKSLLKVGVISYIIYVVINGKLAQIPKLMALEVGQSAQWLGATVFEVALYAGIAMAVIGVVDYVYQWWEYERSLMMSKQEVKDEYKQLEGDPMIKSQRDAIRKQRARERMMSAVKTADVVVRNPEHYAVAIKYDLEKHAEPIVIAKGRDNVALRIVKEAQKYDIYTVENPPLARGLYAAVEINQQIPEKFYHALLDIIIYLNSVGKIDLSNLGNIAKNSKNVTKDELNRLEREYNESVLKNPENKDNVNNKKNINGE